ncbi:MAG TPA: hypothetical protein VFD50_01965 [Thermoleophilia bacterium]|nr:hypothetical protein [Thermoleophilia bacterium]
MLVATFGPTTTWTGKTVTYTDGAFVLEGHGPISAQDVFEYERQGHLVWSMDGIRAWVGARALAEGGVAATPSQSAEWRSERLAAGADNRAKTEPHEAAVRRPVAVTEAPAEAPADVACPVDGKALEDVTAAAVTSKDAFTGLGADDPTRARAIEEAAREHDWGRLAGLYALQAWWLDEEGRDALQVTRLARRAELRALAQQGVALVGVIAADDDTCAACRRVGGRVMTVADALRLMPIPNASCAYRWCRCRWEPADADAA